MVLFVFAESGFGRIERVVTTDSKGAALKQARSRVAQGRATAPDGLILSIGAVPRAIAA